MTETCPVRARRKAREALARVDELARMYVPAANTRRVAMKARAMANLRREAHAFERIARQLEEEGGARLESTEPAGYWGF